MVKYKVMRNRASRILFGVNYDKLSTPEEMDYVDGFMDKGSQRYKNLSEQAKHYLERGGKVPKWAVFYYMNKKRNLKKVL